MSDHTCVERWVPVDGYEGYYEVSDQGRVRSLDRVVPHSYRGQMRVRGRVLKANPDSWGHLQVLLCMGGVCRHRPVHKLVAEHFIGPCPDGLMVLHGAAGQRDNRVSNLSYGTAKQNILDKRRDGTDHNLNKTACPLGHLLQAPNLVACDAREGKRACLACCRGRSIVRSQRRSGRPVSDLKAECDRSYALIMDLPGAEPRVRKGLSPEIVARRRRTIDGRFAA